MTYQLPEPTYPKDAYVMLSECAYTADQMQAAYQAGEARLLALLTSQSSAYDSGYQAGRESMRVECADHVFNMAQWDENNEQWVVLHRAATAIRNLK